jgi:hypothetical protein
MSSYRCFFLNSAGHIFANDSIECDTDTQAQARADWPAPGSEDTELGVLMELEVGHGETEVYARVQA